jgi:hypothetical protein
MDTEWLVLYDFERILQVPHRIQQAMSLESLPCLGQAIPTFELFMLGWENLTKNEPCLELWIRVGLQWARKYYTRMDDTNAYVFAMCESSTC